MIYFIGWSLFLIFFKLYLGFRVVGRDNIPRNGAFIIASNHVSYIDPILLGTSVNRSLNYMARESLFLKRFPGWVMRKLHAFPVSRDNGDLSAIRESIGILNSDKPLVIFPEGTRSKDKALRRPKPGIGFIVARTKVPVIPAYVSGSFDAMPGGVKSIKRYPVRIYIGKRMDFSGYRFDKNNRKEIYQKISDDIMKEVARLKNEYESNSGG